LDGGNARPDDTLLHHRAYGAEYGSRRRNRPANALHIPGTTLTAAGCMPAAITVSIGMRSPFAGNLARQDRDTTGRSVTQHLGSDFRSGTVLATERALSSRHVSTSAYRDRQACVAKILVSAEGMMDAPADTVYGYVADMRERHPRFLPDAFWGFRVE